MTDVFEFEDYMKYLKAKIAENAQKTGYKAQLARAASAPQALISQVLHGKTHLSLDHALKLARFWLMDEEQTEAWLELVQLARASTPELKKHLRAKLATRRKRHEDIAERLQQPRLGNTEQEWEYYTQWMFQAFHMLVMIPRFQDPKAIAQAFHLPLSLVEAQLGRLEQMGLVAREADGRFRATQKRIHLPKTSHVSPINHWAWRQKAMERVHDPRESDLFYSTLHTLSVEDARRIRALLLKAIEEASRIVAPSPEETLVGINIDLFRLA